MYVIPSMGRGGAEMLLANQIPLLIQEGVEATIVTFCSKDDLIRDYRLAVKHMSLDLQNATNTIGALRLLCQLLLRLRRVIRQERPDVVHLNLYTFNAWGRLAARGLCPTITTWHNTDPQMSSTDFRKQVIQWFERWTCRRTDSHLLAVSNDVKKYYCHNLNIPESRVATIYNGITLSRFITQIPVRSNATPRIVIVGRFFYQKAHDIALRAMKIVHDAGIDFQLDLFGIGPLVQDMKALAKELNLDRYVNFAGIVKNVPERLPMYDLFLMPSRFEGFGIAAVEAMASYVPVVATRVSGLEEVIEHEITGLLVPPENPEALAGAVIRLLNDEPLRRRLALAGRKKVEKTFDLAVQVPKLVELYRRIVALDINNNFA